MEYGCQIRPGTHPWGVRASDPAGCFPLCPEGRAARMNPLPKRVFVAALLLAVLVGGGLLYRVFTADDANAVANGPARQQPAVPVIGGVVIQKDMPVLLAAIGTVQPEDSGAGRTRL